MPISVIVPAHQQWEALVKTLLIIGECRPAPSEVLVHVDGGNSLILHNLSQQFQELTVLTSNALQGPGGSRNLLVAAARHEWVANFDDDSFPAHRDYFGRIAALIERFPETAVFSAASHAAEWQRMSVDRVGIFSGCGCVFRKSMFEALGGFVPLPVAYGMEEVDLSLRIHDAGGVILHDPLLRVRHEPPERRRDDDQISAAVLANTFLLPWLRYPWLLMGIGLLQGLSRLRWMLARGQWRAVGRGIAMTPGHLAGHSAERRAVSTLSLLSWLKLRRHPEARIEARAFPAGWKEDSTWTP
ncbi:MAG: glycosyltransferase [Verrucomicrobiales bacterium]|nr:glycosyltransferase [Verrucomicrobiales bacterium]